MEAPQSFHLDAVIFDMDGLMLDTERLAREAWFRTMREWGYHLDEDVYLSVVGTTATRTRQVFRDSLGDDIPIDDMYAHKQRYIDQAIEQNRIPIKPGLIELLDQLDAWRLPKAVASSTSRALVLRKLGVTDLVHRFDTIVGGDEVAHGKPAPDVPLEAARRLGISPNECVVLEDSENGVRAAHAAGMLTIMVPDMKPPTEEVQQLAYRIVPTLHDARIVFQVLVSPLSARRSQR